MSFAPTRIRYRVLIVTAIVAVFMYVDRSCIAQVSTDLKKDLDLADDQIDWVKSAFFWSYALAQVPAGLLGLRFGFRRMLAIYLFSWSLFTAVSGLAAGFAALVGSRLAVGLTEAGAYPTAAALVKSWFPLASRGMANSVVALGGRVGNALGLLLTPRIMPLVAGVMVVNGTADSGWRGTLILFGGLGIAWSVVFWLVVRDSPSAHPGANQAEADLVGTYSVAQTPQPPFRLFIGSRNLWYLSGFQFFVNMGWAFLITNFPDYLQSQHGLTGEAKGNASSVPLFVGCAGMFVGGFLTDRLVRRFGLRLGRMVPILIGTLGCAAAFLFCTTSPSVGAVVVAMCVVTVGTDLGIPAGWGIAQDIGGRRVGPFLGWANMWGNFGSAVCPVVLGLVQRHFGWPAVFFTAAVSYTVATACVLAIDASRPLEPAH